MPSQTINDNETFALWSILSAAIQVASRDTAYESDQANWSRNNPLCGHCGCLAFVVQLVLGGDILSGRDETGERWLWNRLPSGLEVGLSMPEPFQVKFKGRVLPDRKPNPRFMKFAERVGKAL